MTAQIQLKPLFRWRGCHGDDQEETTPNYWEIEWRKRDKLIAFTFFCLACRYDDVIANVEQGGWVYLPVRILELIFVSIMAFCTSVIMTFRYGDCSLEPSLTLSMYSSSFLAAESDTTVDMLSERDVETQTIRRDYVKETSILKRRHRREMRRLTRQQKGIKRCLANQWREASHTLKDRNQLLFELHERLVPIEKEMADHLIEKEIIEHQLEEERRRYTDLMTRIDRVQQQLEAVGACANYQQMNDTIQQEGQTELNTSSGILEEQEHGRIGATNSVPNTFLSQTIQALHSVLQAEEHETLHVSRITPKDYTEGSANSSAGVENQIEAIDRLTEVTNDVTTSPSLTTSKAAALVHVDGLVDALNKPDAELATEQGTTLSPNHTDDNNTPLQQISPDIEGATRANMIEDDIRINSTESVEAIKEEGGTHTEDPESGFQTVTRANKRNKRKAKSNKNKQNSEHEMNSPRLDSVSYRSTRDTSYRHSENQVGQQPFTRNTNMNGNQAFSNNLDGQHYQDPSCDPSFMPRNEYERQNLMWMQMNHVMHQQEQERQFYNAINGGSGWYNRYKGMAGRGHRGRV